jgi:hypothetical protein
MLPTWWWRAGSRACSHRPLRWPAQSGAPGGVEVPGRERGALEGLPGLSLRSGTLGVPRFGNVDPAGHDEASRITSRRDPGGNIDRPGSQSRRPVRSPQRVLVRALVSKIALEAAGKRVSPARAGQRALRIQYRPPPRAPGHCQAAAPPAFRPLDRGATLLATAQFGVQGRLQRYRHSRSRAKVIAYVQKQPDFEARVADGHIPPTLPRSISRGLEDLGHSRAPGVTIDIRHEPYLVIWSCGIRACWPPSRLSQLGV